MVSPERPPGNPDGIRGLARRWRGAEGGARDAAGTLRSAANDIGGPALGLKGDYAAKIKDGIAEVPDALEKLARGYGGCAAALEKYATTLEGSQRTWDKAARDFDGEQVQVNSARIDLDRIQPGLAERLESPLGRVHLVSPHADEINAAWQRYQRAKDEAARHDRLALQARDLRDGAENTCRVEIEQALRESGTKNLSWWEKAKEWAKTTFTTWAGFVSLATSVSTLLGALTAIVFSSTRLFGEAILLAVSGHTGEMGVLAFLPLIGLILTPGKVPWLRNSGPPNAVEDIWPRVISWLGLDSGRPRDVSVQDRCKSSRDNGAGFESAGTPGGDPFINSLGDPVIGGSAPGIPEPPRWSPPDAGAGEHASKRAGLDDYTVAGLARSGAYVLKEKWPDASRNLLHFLGNSGEPLPQNVNKMIDDCPGLATAVAGRQRRVGEAAVADAKIRGVTGIVTYPVNSPWDGHYIEKEEDSNWYYAAGGVNFNQTGSVTVYPPPHPGEPWTYVVNTITNFRDQYNWDGGKQTTIGPVAVTDESLANLHRSGLAREYTMTGASSMRSLEGMT